MAILFFNALLYFGVFFYYWKKDKGWNLFNFLILYYAVIASMGWIILYNGIYERLLGDKSNVSLSIMPYFLCFISFFVFFHPLHKLSKNVQITVPPIKWINKIVILWLIIMMMYTVLRAVEASITIKMGLGEAYALRHMEGETLFDYSDNIFLRRLGNVGSILQECTVPLIILYCIDNLQKRRNKKLILFLIVFSFLPNIFMGIAIASRGNLYSVFLKMIFFILLFKKHVSSKIKKIVIVIFCASLSFMAFYSLMITESRMENSRVETPMSSIVRYFGEPFPNLGYSFWGKVKYHPMGERLFPEIYGTKKLEFESTSDRYLYWERVTHVPVLNFKTMFGDLYIEFGVVGALIFVVLFSRLFIKVMNGEICYYNIGLAYIYFQMCFMGFAGLTKLSGMNLLIWGITLGISLWLKKVNDLQRKRL